MKVEDGEKDEKNEDDNFKDKELVILWVKVSLLLI